MTNRPNAEVSSAAVAVAAQRIAAYADKHDLPITPAHCEELAEDLLRAYQEFVAQQSSAPAGPSADT
ncbi:hypothetical protein [Phytohabitans rumicis]|uniref:Uncharacterized protein n=1 Tax=Phytohabitans rumicis TaxID=1076125 RepID=A0A6V8L7I3_9ACTN|nr:hypothetical protein [Phytohabitans rumicis]GFJ92234.1 hypothetical protein Prum_058760 [Phytohabitans rumicis]